MSEKTTMAATENKAISGEKASWLIGVPTKYGEVALLPSYVANFGYGNNVLTRDNVVVTFVKVKHWDKPDADISVKCNDLYKMPFLKFEEVWRRRMTTDFGDAWDLVEMHKVDKAVTNGDFEVV